MVVPAGGGDDAVEGAEVFLLAALDDREEAGRAAEAHRSGVGLPHNRLGLGLDGDTIALQAPADVGGQTSGAGPRAGRCSG